MRSVALALVIVLGATACGGREEDAAATGGRGGGSAAPVTAGVRLFVGTEEIATVTPGQVASWPRLDGFLPERARRLGKWEAIATDGAKRAELARPFETYRDYVPALFPGDGGAISFGLFDPVEYGKRGAPALREDAITELRVTLDASGARGENDHAGGDAIDPAKLQLAVVTKAGTRTLTGAELLAIPREAQPGGEQQGWRLATILAAAGVTATGKVRLTDASGTSLPLDAADQAGDAVPFIKLNRQGSLRFRLYRKQGDGWQAAGDLRALVKVEILD